MSSFSVFVSDVRVVPRTLFGCIGCGDGGDDEYTSLGVRGSLVTGTRLRLPGSLRASVCPSLPDTQGGKEGDFERTARPGGRETRFRRGRWEGRWEDPFLFQGRRSPVRNTP